MSPALWEAEREHQDDQERDPIGYPCHFPSELLIGQL